MTLGKGETILLHSIVLLVSTLGLVDATADTEFILVDSVSENEATNDVLGENKEDNGDDKPRVGNGANPDDKVTLCHIPPGNPEAAHTITVSPSAVQAHLDHGDSLGPCEPPDFVIRLNETMVVRDSQSFLIDRGGLPHKVSLFETLAAEADSFLKDRQFQVILAESLLLNDDIKTGVNAHQKIEIRLGESLLLDDNIKTDTTLPQGFELLAESLSVADNVKTNTTALQRFRVILEASLPFTDSLKIKTTGSQQFESLLTDSLSMSDNVKFDTSVVQQFETPLVESLSLSDSIKFNTTGTQGFKVVIEDSLDISSNFTLDTIAPRQFEVNFEESLTLDEKIKTNTTGIQQFKIILDDKLFVSDNFDTMAPQGFVKLLSDSLSLSDDLKINTTATQQLEVRLVDSLSASERIKLATSAFQQFEVSLDEELTLASEFKKNTTAPQQLEIHLSDSLPFSESMGKNTTAPQQLEIILDDSLNISDSSSAIKNKPTFSAKLDEKIIVEASAEAEKDDKKPKPPIPEPPTPEPPTSDGPSQVSGPGSRGGSGRTGVSGGSGGSGGGGGGFVTPPQVEGQIRLYEVAWQLCEKNTMTITAGPKDPDLGVKVRTTIDGVVSATLTEEQPYQDRSVYKVSLSPDETFALVQVEAVSGRLGSFVQESINLDECSGKVTVYSEPRPQEAPKTLSPPELLKSQGKVFESRYQDSLFQILYRANGAINGLDVDEQKRSVAFSFDRTIDGTATIQLPRELVDAQENRFIIISNGDPNKVQEFDVLESTKDYAILDVSLDDSKNITVFGTQVVPEFGLVTLGILGMSLVLVVFTRFKLFRGLC